MLHGPFFAEETAVVLPLTFWYHHQPIATGGKASELGELSGLKAGPLLNAACLFSCASQPSGIDAYRLSHGTTEPVEVRSYGSA